MILKKPAPCLTMKIFQPHTAEEVLIDISQTRSACTRRSPTGHRLRTGLDLRYGWVVCLWRCSECWSTTFLLEDVDVVCKTRFPTTTFFFPLKMVGIIHWMDIGSVLQRFHWRRMTRQVVQGWYWVRTSVLLHTMVNWYVKAFDKNPLQDVLIVYLSESKRLCH